MAAANENDPAAYAAFEQLAEELHKPFRRRFTQRPVISFYPWETLALDLVDMQSKEKWNDGYRYLLTCVDLFSKFAYAIPIRDKTASAVEEAFAAICKDSGRTPRQIWVDKGKEFFNRNMDAFCKENFISRYSTYGDSKAANVEAFNKTLKNAMYKRFTVENSYRYLDFLEELLKEYNTKRQSRLGMSPIEALQPENYQKLFEKEQLKIALASQKAQEAKPKKFIPFAQGDIVRISRLKGIFEKGYDYNWSEELFKIRRVLETEPISYELQEWDGSPIEGAFYQNELQIAQVDANSVFRIEKTIREKKQRGVPMILVKWLGWPAKYNSWVPKNNVLYEQ